MFEGETSGGRNRRILLYAFDNSGNMLFPMSDVEGVRLSVRDSSVASMTNGVVSARAAGRTIITASFNRFHATAELVVTRDNSASIPTGPVVQERTLMPMPEFPAEGAVFRLGETIQFTANAGIVARMNAHVEWEITHVDSGQRFGGTLPRSTATWVTERLGTHTFTMRFIYSNPSEASPWSLPRTFEVRR